MIFRPEGRSRKSHGLQPQIWLRQVFVDQENGMIWPLEECCDPVPSSTATVFRSCAVGLINTTTTARMMMMMMMMVMVIVIMMMRMTTAGRETSTSLLA